MTQLAADLLQPLLIAAATWGAIRSDIRNLHEGVRDAKSAVRRAHERIDALSTHRGR